MPLGSFTNYWMFWHKKSATGTGALAAGDNAFYNTDQASSGTKETTNWETASKVPYDLKIFAISMVLGASDALADLAPYYNPGTYLEVLTGNTRIYEQLACYLITGTGPLVNFSLASAAAQQFMTVGHPDPNSLFKLPTGLMVHNGEAFSVNLHIVTGASLTSTDFVTIVLHTLRRDIAYDS